MCSFYEDLFKGVKGLISSPIARFDFLPLVYGDHQWLDHIPSHQVNRPYQKKHHINRGGVREILVFSLL